jgi:nucleotide-binding universal stress UspA family protein
MQGDPAHDQSDRTRRYDTVLVPTDGSEHARAGARHGVRIANGFDATVHAVHVTDTGAGLTPVELSQTTSAGDERRDDGQEALDSVAHLGDESGVTVRTELLEGNPAELLQSYLTDNNIDIVAMGTRGRSNIERHLLGSVTDRMVRTSPVPVLTARIENDPALPVEGDYTDILLPTRGGDGSELAVDHAVSIAARFGATLHVIYVVDVRSQAAKHDTYELGELVDELRTTVTDAVTDRADEAGIDTRVAIQQGTPHSAIQRYAADHEIDLIIMGTHGRGRVEQFLLGSITERTVRTADVPVITVRLDEWFGADGGGKGY